MSEPFDRLKSIVLEACRLDGTSRAAFLARACATNHELRREAESLLAFADADLSVLAIAAAARLFETDDSAMPASDDTGQPQRIGPYRVVRRLGQGGMGTVFEAEQVQPIRRTVALKLIRRGLDTDAVISRFRSERQALALMDHPAIARVLDAGASNDGRPYFVMELVDGVPITQYCLDRQLEVREMLRLFLAVCQGVRHAHQKGIVHRDLKPSNVLVGNTDGIATPKIIDFGIAKAIDAPAADAAVDPATGMGATIGTPDYMSPEQAGVIPDGVDTRTDVYSLGVLLYEMLTGRRPYAFGTYNPAEIARVLQTDPPPPSEAAPQRRRLLIGDLDNIIAKALARYPGSRYASVEQLADDVRRHLDGEPVIAREATWRYRTAKFVRRHAMGMAAAAALVVLVVASAAILAVQATRLAAERDRARAAEQHAREQAATAEAVSGFLVDLFETSDPSEARGNTITAREVLDRGAARIDSDLRDTPQVQATLLRTMGLVYQNLGLYAASQGLLQRALDRRRALYGDEDAAVAESLDELAVLRRQRGDYAGAEPLFREALAIKRRTLGPDHPSIAVTLTNLGYVLRNKDRLAEAEAVTRENLAMRLRLYGPDHHAVAEGMHELGATLWRKGDLEGAEDYLRKAIDLDQRLLGENDPTLAVRWNILGQVLNARGQLVSAEDAHRRAVTINTVLYPGEHPNVAHASQGLAIVLFRQGKLEEAESVITTALDIHRRLVGETSPWVASDTQLLGSLKIRTGLYREAERLLRPALALAITLDGPESSRAAFSLLNLSSAIRHQGRLAEAEALVRQAEALFLKTRGDAHPDYADYLWELASTIAVPGRFDEAEALHRRALEIRRRNLPRHTPEIALSLASLGALLLDQGNAAGAEPLLQEATAIYRDVFPETDRLRREAEQALDRCNAALHGRPRPAAQRERTD